MLNNVRAVRQLRQAIIPFICKLDGRERLGSDAEIERVKLSAVPATLLGQLEGLDAKIFPQQMLDDIMPTADEVQLAYQWVFQELLIKLAENNSNDL